MKRFIQEFKEFAIKATRCPHYTSKLDGFRIDPAELNK